MLKMRKNQETQKLYTFVFRLQSKNKAKHESFYLQMFFSFVFFSFLFHISNELRNNKLGNFYFINFFLIISTILHNPFFSIITIFYRYIYLFLFEISIIEEYCKNKINTCI